jgi:hypothetical protein
LTMHYQCSIPINTLLVGCIFCKKLMFSSLHSIEFCKNISF